MKRTHLIIVIFVCLWAVVSAADKEKGRKTQSDKADKTGKKELKLEDLLPEKSLFGPSALGMAFSRDGKYAAYLYRPYKERRHGNDLYIYDVDKGKAAFYEMMEFYFVSNKPQGRICFLNRASED